MSKTPFASALAGLLIIAIVTPAAFFIAPPRVSAAGSAVSCIGGILGLASGAGATAAGAVLGVPVSNISIETTSGLTSGATIGSCVYDSIIIPLARMAIRAMLMQMTASVVNWINNTPGKNGTSAASFVTNLSRNLQGVGDAVATAFIARAATAFISPFGSAISASLRQLYAGQTSMAGFYATHQCTLPGTLQNQQAFLAGNWSQGGGIVSWFALTTEDQNNPYTLYQAAASQLGSNVGQAQTNRRQDLAQSGGFLSWCGTTDSAAATQSSASSGYQACIAQCDANGYSAACADNCTTSFSQSGGSIGGATSNGVNPGDACTNSDGTPGTVQTPGSVIHDYTQKAVVNSGFDQLVSANDLDTMLNTIVQALLTQVLSGVGGLLGAGGGGSSSGGARSSVVSQLQNYTGTSVNAGQTSYQTAQSVLNQLGTYTSAWQTIISAANTASTSAANLASFCTAAANTAALAAFNGTNNTGIQTTPAQAQLDSMHSPFIDAARAQAAAVPAVITTEIAPVPVQAQAAISAASTTQTLALQVQAEAVGTVAAPSLASDIATLVTMPPSITDISNAQQNAQVYGGATASPAGSLTVSGGSRVDQMNLISANAAALQTTVCNPNSSLYVASGGNGLVGGG